MSSVDQTQSASEFAGRRLNEIMDGIKGMEALNPMTPDMGLRVYGVMAEVAKVAALMDLATAIREHGCGCTR